MFMQNRKRSTIFFLETVCQALDSDYLLGIRYRNSKLFWKYHSILKEAFGGFHLSIISKSEACKFNKIKVLSHLEKLSEYLPKFFRTDFSRTYLIDCKVYSCLSISKKLKRRYTWTIVTDGETKIRSLILGIANP